MGTPVAGTNGTVMSPFARTVYENKYAMTVNGRKEVWAETARRVASSVMGAYLPDAGRTLPVRGRQAVPPS